MTLNILKTETTMGDECNPVHWRLAPMEVQNI